MIRGPPIEYLLQWNMPLDRRFHMILRQDVVCIGKATQGIAIDLDYTRPYAA